MKKTILIILAFLMIVLDTPRLASANVNEDEIRPGGIFFYNTQDKSEVRWQYTLLVNNKSQEQKETTIFKKTNTIINKSQFMGGGRDEPFNEYELYDVDVKVSGSYGPPNPMGPSMYNYDSSANIGILKAKNEDKVRGGYAKVRTGGDSYYVVINEFHSSFPTLFNALYIMNRDIRLPVNLSAANTPENNCEQLGRDWIEYGDVIRALFQPAPGNNERENQNPNWVVVDTTNSHTRNILVSKLGLLAEVLGLKVEVDSLDLTENGKVTAERLKDLYGRMAAAITAIKQEKGTTVIAEACPGITLNQFKFNADLVMQLDLPPYSDFSELNAEMSKLKEFAEASAADLDEPEESAPGGECGKISEDSTTFAQIIAKAFCSIGLIMNTTANWFLEKATQWLSMVVGLDAY